MEKSRPGSDQANAGISMSVFDRQVYALLPRSALLTRGPPDWPSSMSQTD